MVSPYDERYFSSCQPMSPFLQCQLDGQHLPVTYIIIVFRGCQPAWEEGTEMYSKRLSKASCWDKTASNPASKQASKLLIRTKQGKYRSWGEPLIKMNKSSFSPRSSHSRMSQRGELIEGGSQSTVASNYFLAEICNGKQIPRAVGGF